MTLRNRWAYALGAGALALTATISSAVAQKAPLKLGLTVRLPRGSIVYMPVTQDDDIIGVVPLANERVSGIRFLARPDKTGTKVYVEVSALSQHGGPGSLESANYGEIMKWRGEAVGTYEGKEGDGFDLSALGRFNLPTLTLKIVPAHPSPMPGESAPFCSAGQAVGSPNPGNCMTMSGLGMCCRAGASNSIALFKKTATVPSIARETFN